jgi:hypothetical protein
MNIGSYIRRQKKIVFNSGGFVCLAVIDFIFDVFGRNQLR